VTGRAERARQVERDFPGWHIWISSLDRWWAVRQGPDAHHGRDDRRPMTVDADDAAGLRTVLANWNRPEPENVTRGPVRSGGSVTGNARAGSSDEAQEPGHSGGYGAIRRRPGHGMQ
jgi:hypothetical protein